MYKKHWGKMFILVKKIKKKNRLRTDITVRVNFCLYTYLQFFWYNRFFCNQVSLFLKINSDRQQIKISFGLLKNYQ